MSRKIYHVEYYLSKDDNSMLFATLKEDHICTFYFDENVMDWFFSDIPLDKITRPLEKIDKNLAIFITMGKFVEDKYKEMFGLNIYKSKTKRKDSIDELVEGLVSFAKNQEKALNLSMKELDAAYHSGYIDLMNEHYIELNKRKEKYPYLEVEKLDDDYVFHFSEKILHK